METPIRTGGVATILAEAAAADEGPILSMVSESMSRRIGPREIGEQNNRGAEMLKVFAVGFKAAGFVGGVTIVGIDMIRVLRLLEQDLEFPCAGRQFQIQASPEKFPSIAV